MFVDIRVIHFPAAILSVEGIKNLQCKFCEKYFGRKEHLRRHIKTIHGCMRQTASGALIPKKMDFSADI